MSGLHIAYEGVTFANVRAAICATYFMREGLTEAVWKEALGYVLPSQHNFENPIEPGSQDTWIQFWIDEDDRLTQDYIQDNHNIVRKVAVVTLRFLGTRAEVWAKAFHHLTKRKSVPFYFHEYCNGEMLEYVSPIIPINVDYFRPGNVTVAHDLSFKLYYTETMQFDWKPLEYISVSPGEIISGEVPQGVKGES